MKKTCEFCRWWVEVFKEPRGYCRRLTEVPLKSWCEEWKAKDKEK